MAKAFNPKTDKQTATNILRGIKHVAPNGRKISTYDLLRMQGLIVEEDKK